MDAMFSWVFRVFPNKITAFLKLVPWKVDMNSWISGDFSGKEMISFRFPCSISVGDRKHQLGGGNSNNFLIFTRIFGEKPIQFDDCAYFFRWVGTFNQQPVNVEVLNRDIGSPWFTSDLRLDMAPTRQMWEQNYGAWVVCWVTNSLEVEGVSALKYLKQWASYKQRHKVRWLYIYMMIYDIILR